MLRVKVTSADGGPWNPMEFFGDLGGVPLEVNFFVNDPGCTHADFWFVIEDVWAGDTSCFVPPQRAIYLTAESAWPPTYFLDSPARRRFLEQFGEIYSCHAIDLPRAHHQMPFLPWLIDVNHTHPRRLPVRTFDELWSATYPEKCVDVSVICSDQMLTEGHRLRWHFVSALKRHLGPRLHWFGNGVRPIDRKWDAIAPYRYHLVLENSARPGVVTEKILDSYLGYSFPIYWGAPDILHYFPETALVAINIEDFSGSLSAIDKLIEVPPSTSQLEALISQRSRVLTDFNVFARIQKLAIEKYGVQRHLSASLVRISPLAPHHAARPTVLSRVRRRVARGIAP